jgi:hypothetical protein
MVKPLDVVVVVPLQRSTHPILFSSFSFLCVLCCDRFLRWCNLRLRRTKLRAGSSRLEQVWLRAKYRLAFVTWPGYVQNRLARDMLLQLQLKKRSPMLLVECSETDGAEVVEPPPPAPKKRRPTMLQRAFKYGFVRHETDVDGLHYCQRLCSSVLGWWRDAMAREVALRMRGFEVRSAVHARSLQRCLQHWVETTPQTSHRRAVWLVRGLRRAHDDYQHKCQRKKEFDAAMALRKKHKGEYDSSSEED